MEVSEAQPNAQAFQDELDRLLASPEFSASRQLQDFLRFTAGKALAGETHLEQVDIATAVLGRKDDFNPIEDAAVRKLASLARQRLDQYYRRTGTPPVGMVTLPLRSYLPHFEAAPPPAATQPKTRWWLVAIPAALAVGLALWFLVRYPRVEPGTEFRITTARGDIVDPGADIAPSAVQLGPALREIDTVVAELDFTPVQEAQQAGIVVWQGPDDFIKLGRRFHGRNQIDLILESGTRRATSIAFDADGQSGRRLWLALRRQQNTYRAFTSVDGSRWDAVGEPLTPATPFAAPRAGIYAFHGRREATPATAVFRHFSTGVEFGAGLIEPNGLERGGNCSSSGADMQPHGVTLSIQVKPPQPGCNVELARPLNGGDWQLETRIDYQARPGASAGISVRGAKSTVRLVRYVLNGPSVALIHDMHTLVGVPDLNGSPAIVLRMRARAGQITGGYSVDGEHFRELGQRIAVDALGGDLRGGLRVTTTTLDPEDAAPPARFYWFRESVLGTRYWRP